MRGKKFNAAEKHFKEKELELRKEMKRYIDFADEIKVANSLLFKENEKLKIENTEIKMKYEQLLEYSKLSEDDIQRALKRDKSLEQVNSLINMASRLRF
jgi:hypothetical protein